MHTFLRVVVFSLVVCWVGGVFGQTVDRLTAVVPLLGQWVGTSEGMPGFAAGQRHTVRDLNGRFLRVNARSVYPKQEKNPKGETHASLAIWSFERKRGALMLRVFDTLGFASTYAQDLVTSTPEKIVMVSEHLENVPDGWKARYTYSFISTDEFRELFELDMDGKGFKTYVAGRYVRMMIEIP